MDRGQRSKKQTVKVEHRREERKMSFRFTEDQLRDLHCWFDVECEYIGRESWKCEIRVSSTERVVIGLYQYTNEGWTLTADYEMKCEDDVRKLVFWYRGDFDEQKRIVKTKSFPEFWKDVLRAHFAHAYGMYQMRVYKKKTSSTVVFEIEDGQMKEYFPLHMPRTRFYNISLHFMTLSKETRTLQSTVTTMQQEISMLQQRAAWMMEKIEMMQMYSIPIQLVREKNALRSRGNLSLIDGCCLFSGGFRFRISRSGEYRMSEFSFASMEESRPTATSKRLIRVCLNQKDILKVDPTSCPSLFIQVLEQDVVDVFAIYDDGDSTSSDSLLSCSLLFIADFIN
jgi:hypothetical protein